MVDMVVGAMKNSITVRKVKWMTAYLRPVAMPSTKCPVVKDYDSGESHTAVMCVSHCLPCAYAAAINLDMKARTGEVHCAAPK